MVDAFGALAPWPAAGDLTPEEWERSIVTAGAVQRADPDEAEHAIAEFLGRGQGFGAAADETRLFLLLRVVFDLPEHAPEEERRPFKGWVNWPPPAPDGTVSLAWPITFHDGHPALVDPYVGSEGPRYAAVEEYRDLLGRFPFRAL